MAARKYAYNNVRRRALALEPDHIRARLMSKVRISENGCWLWRAYRTKDGYGHFSIADRMLEAHRVAWELDRGAIPAGLEIDHICKNPSCVNPQHMELVTHAENLRRGDGWGGKHFKKQTCIHGHAMRRVFLPGAKRHRRICDECRRAWWKRSSQRKNGEAGR